MAINIDILKNNIDGAVTSACMRASFP